jgi:hypothetical protein
MEFPITRLKLHDGGGYYLKKEIYDKEFTKILTKYVTDQIEKIVYNMIKSLPNTPCTVIPADQKYIYIFEEPDLTNYELEKINQLKYFSEKISLKSHVSSLIYDHMKRLFPDCDITLDPMRIYLSIDWSRPML